MTSLSGVTRNNNNNNNRISIAPYGRNFRRAGNWKGTEWALLQNSDCNTITPTVKGAFKRMWGYE